MSRAVLGINAATVDNTELVHDSSAAVVIDGRITAAVSEERLSRVKCDGVFPHRAIEHALKLSGLELKDVDAIAVGRLDYPENAPKYIKYVARTYMETGLLLARRGLGGVRNIVQRRHRKMPPEFSGKPINFIEHHHAHAAAVYYTCPWEDATVITLDGVGDAICGSVYEARGGAMKKMWECNGHYSPGVFYGAVTAGLGFRVNRHEGKVVGLAAYTTSEPCYQAMKDVLTYDSAKREFRGVEVARVFRGLEMDIMKSVPFLAPLKEKFTREEISYAAQRILEETVTAFARDAVAATGIRRVALSGGVFANVKLNQRIYELDCVDNVFVYPDMGDGGLAAGAALETWARLVRGGGGRPLPTFIGNVYLGGGFTEADCRRAIEARNDGWSVREEADAPRAIAQAVADGKIVGLFQGGMEYGPRALGDRTILASPVDPAINDQLNNRLKRSEFMPFAPSIMEEQAGRVFKGWKPEHAAARFMTITYDVEDYGREKGPAVVHIDNTARPQVVRREDNPRYHEILSRWLEITGNPLIVNTSFNIHEEPIIYSPEDAIRAFKMDAVDTLALGNFLIEKKPPR